MNSKNNNNIRLKQMLNNIYFIHMTKDETNLKKILKDGKIKLGSEIPIKNKYLSGYVDEPYVFTNIYNSELDNIEWFNEYSLIIKGDIIENQSVELIGGWGNIFIDKIEPTDSAEVKKKKLNKFFKFIKNPKGLPKLVLELPKNHHHEVKFDSPIDIKKYLFGLSISYTNEEEKKKKIEKIKKLLKKNNLENVKIISYDKKIIG
jgi:hypothetical protein